LIRENDTVGTKQGDIFSFAIVCAEIINMKPIWEQGETKGNAEGPTIETNKIPLNFFSIFFYRNSLYAAQGWPQSISAQAGAKQSGFVGSIVAFGEGLLE
jgi:hypothetical protein